MSERQTYTCGNGHEVEWDVYYDALRKAWAVYGALVGEGRVPAYEYDGSDKQQMEKYHNILMMVSTITDALASFNGDTAGHIDMDEWKAENYPGPDEDFEDVPTDPDARIQWIKAAIKASKLPYKLVHVDSEIQELVDDLQSLVNDAKQPPAAPPAKKGKGGKKSKSSKK